MSPLRSLVIALILCGTLAAEEAKQSLTLEQLEAIAIQPAKRYEETNSRVVPEMQPLFKEGEIIYTGKSKYRNKNLRFRLHVPENMEPGKKYPLILWLHGTGEAGDDNQDQLVHLHHIITYLTGPKKRDFFLLVPQAPKDHFWWDSYSMYWRMVSRSKLEPEARAKQFAEVEKMPEVFEDSPLGFALAMVDQVVKELPVDPNRITVSGLSSGGDGVWRALERRPELFAAAVPLVSWRALRPEVLEKNPELKKIPVWAIYSSDDNEIEEARADFARAEAAGCNVKKSEFGLCGHNAWTPAMLQGDIFSWLLSRAKKDGEYVAVTDANVNPDDMKGIVEVATRASGEAPKLAPEAPPAPLVPEPPKDAVAETRRRSSGRPSGVTVELPVVPDLPVIVRSVRHDVEPARHPAQDGLYAQLAFGYWKAKDTESFKRTFAKLSDRKKVEVLEGVLVSEVQHPQPNVAFLKEIEALIDELRTEPRPVVPANSGDTVPGFLPGSKIVEDCDREWAMTSESLYGMFPADWDKEGKRLPDFVVKSTAEEFGRALRDDPAKLKLVCESILSLEYRPMSSPWFETSGGRFRSDIKYTLSAKGNVLGALLRQSDQAHAKKALEKIESILDQ